MLRQTRRVHEYVRMRKRTGSSLEETVVAFETRVPLVIKVVSRIAPTFPLTVRVALWTVLERIMAVT